MLIQSVSTPVSGTIHPLTRYHGGVVQRYELGCGVECWGSVVLQWSIGRVVSSVRMMHHVVMIARVILVMRRLLGPLMMVD